jgi:hypothetical protein
MAQEVSKFEEASHPGLRKLWSIGARLLNAYDRLANAIREHRDQKGDDRCWLDDVNLYAALADGRESDLRLPPEPEFLESCRRYWRQRQCPATAGTMRTGEKTIAQLQAEIESLRAERDSLRAQLQAEAAARAGVEGERDDGRARADEAVGSLDQLADLLADSVELPIGQTDAVERLNEIIDQLASRRKGVRDGD